MKFIAPEFANINTLRQLASKLGISTKGKKQQLCEAVIKAYRKATSPAAVAQYARLSARAWVGSKIAYAKTTQVANIAWTNIKHYAPMVLLGAVLVLLQFLYCLAVAWSWLVDTAEEVDAYYQQQIDSRVLGLEVEEPQLAEVVLVKKVSSISKEVIKQVKPLAKKALVSVKPQVVKLVNRVKPVIAKYSRKQYQQDRLTAVMLLGFAVTVSVGHIG